MAEEKPERVSRRGRVKEGRPPFEPTDEQRRQVKTLAGLGIKHDDIRSLIKSHESNEPISRNTLTKCFAAEIREGTVIAKSKVGEALYQKAIKGDVHAIKWWEQTRAHLRAPISVVGGEEDDQPVRIADADGLSPEERAIRILAIIDKAKRRRDSKT